MTESELVTLIREELGDLTQDLALSDFTNAVSVAERETGFDLPQTSDFRVEVLRKRAIRHSMYYLMISAARKFRAEGFHLDQRYKHYREIVRDLDEEYAKLLEDYPEEFLDAITVSDNAYKMFGSQIDAGFQSDALGRDTTYTDDNEVIVTPNDAS